MKMFKWFFVLCLMVFLVEFHLKNVAFAADAAVAVEQPAPVPLGDKVVGELKAVDSKIPDSIPPVAVGVLVFLIEAGARLYPSAKPKSLLLLVSSVFGLIGSIFSKVSGLLDGLVQNIKSE